MDKKSKSFWMYTIILFTVALVIVLISLFMTDYKADYESNVQAIQNELLALKNENVKLKEEKAGLEVKVNQMSAENADFREKEGVYAEAVEAIYLADGLCISGRYTEAKEKLDTVDPEILKEQIRSRYDAVKAKIDANI